MLLEGKYEENLDHLNEEEEEYYTEAFWTYTGQLWELYIQGLCNGNPISELGFWPGFYEKCINNGEWVRYMEQLYTEIPEEETVDFKTVATTMTGVPVPEEVDLNQLKADFKRVATEMTGGKAKISVNF